MLAEFNVLLVDADDVFALQLGDDAAGLRQEVHLVTAHGTSLCGVEVVGIIRDLGLFAMLPFLDDLVFDVIRGTFLFAAAEITDRVHKEHRLVTVGVGELLCHLEKGVDMQGGMGITESHILNGDGQQPPPHLFVELRAGDVHLVGRSQSIFLQSASNRLLQHGDQLITGDPVSGLDVGPGIIRHKRFFRHS